MIHFVSLLFWHIRDHIILDAVFFQNIYIAYYRKRLLLKQHLHGFSVFDIMLKTKVCNSQPPYLCFNPGFELLTLLHLHFNSSFFFYPLPFFRVYFAIIKQCQMLRVSTYKKRQRKKSIEKSVLRKQLGTFQNDV